MLPKYMNPHLSARILDDFDENYMKYVSANSL